MGKKVKGGAELAKEYGFKPLSKEEFRDNVDREMHGVMIPPPRNEKRKSAKPELVLFSPLRPFKIVFATIFSLWMAFMRR